MEKDFKKSDSPLTLPCFQPTGIDLPCQTRKLTYQLPTVFTFQYQQGQDQLAILYIRKLLDICINKRIVICPDIVLPFTLKVVLYIFLSFLLYFWGDSFEYDSFLFLDSIWMYKLYGIVLTDNPY